MGNFVYSRRKEQQSRSMEYNYLLDMDGTIYRGSQPIPHAREFIQYLMERNRRFLMLTNCPGNSPEYLVDKLERMGIHVSRQHILTSGQATASYIARIHPAARVYLIGSEALKMELIQKGLHIVDKDPDMVVVGYDRNFTYTKMEKACWWILKGCSFICTNMDTAIPEGDRLVPHTGAIVSSIQTVTDVEPLVVGKPSPIILEEAFQRLQCTKEECCIIGDRLDTDILTGIRYGIPSYLVLTGVTDPLKLQNSSILPTRTFQDLGELMEEEEGKI